ncbi:hypothetical protein [Nonomuraea sp. SYSU D8015]|uniref:hypothetical protein n=1 Tax=Nonomuraea sp. SYSU D8015 TaxID=2593644 RepID=UPI001CB73C35|nr:hypothetical protein [Nonomuraea sp. SYSU D8015]
MNLPASHTSPEQWQNLVNALASASTMYRFPTGETWPFVLPSTSDELLGDIHDFVAGREPRFELVYDQGLTQTEWQFALWTDLTRAELEQLFPEPEGTASKTAHPIGKPASGWSPKAAASGDTGPWTHRRVARPPLRSDDTSSDHYAGHGSFGEPSPSWCCGRRKRFPTRRHGGKRQGSLRHFL